MALQTIEYAHTESPLRGMPVSANVWCAALVGISIMVLLAIILDNGGPTAVMSLWFIAWLLGMSPLPAAVCAGCALIVRQRWRLFVTLASAFLCGHTAIVAALVTVEGLPKNEGALLLVLAVGVSCILSCMFSGSAAAFVTYRRSWYLPRTPAWHATWLRLAPKILFVWLVGLPLVLWAIQSMMGSHGGRK